MLVGSHRMDIMISANHPNAFEAAPVYHHFRVKRNNEVRPFCVRVTGIRLLVDYNCKPVSNSYAPRQLFILAKNSWLSFVPLIRFSNSFIASSAFISER